MNYIDTERLKHDIDKALDQAQEKAKNYKSMAQERFEKAKEMGKYKREKMQQYVRENPEKSMLIAMGIGAFIAMMLAAKKKKHMFCRHCDE